MPCRCSETTVAGCQCAVDDSATVVASGTGSTVDPYTFAVVLSDDEGQSIEPRADGLYVARQPEGGTKTVTTDENGYSTWDHGLDWTPRMVVCVGQAPIAGTADVPGFAVVGAINSATVQTRWWSSSGLITEAEVTFRWTAFP
ncbi:MAG TPA: hypothetical protein VGB14_16270 [Acidimicrobiales bacterium]|jgi:hypothetical protein